MSSFLTERGTAPGVAFGTDPKAFQATQRERELRDWLLVDVLGSAAYKDHARWVLDKGLIDGFELPISQVIGFTQGVPKQARKPGSSTTTSLTYTDLLDGVGPQLTGLSDGIYLLLYGAAGSNSGTGYSALAIQVNSVAVDTNDETSTNATADVGLMYAAVKTLTADNNTVTVKYKVSVAGTARFYSRWLVAIKQSNV